jgi:hypothetical protein
MDKVEEEVNGIRGMGGRIGMGRDTARDFVVNRPINSPLSSVPVASSTPSKERARLHTYSISAFEMN